MKNNLEFEIASSLTACALFQAALSEDFKNWERIASCDELQDIQAYRLMGSDAPMAFQERIAQYYNTVGRSEIAHRLIGARTQYPAFEKWKVLVMQSDIVSGVRITQSRKDYMAGLSEHLNKRHGIRLISDVPIFKIFNCGEVYYECLMTKYSFSNFLYFCENGSAKGFQNHSGLMCVMQTHQISEESEYDILACEMHRAVILLQENFISLEPPTDNSKT